MINEKIAIALIVLAMGYRPANAEVLYDNGSLKGQSATNIGFGVLVANYATSDSFELKGAGTIDGFSFGSWSPYANSVSIVGWELGNNYFSNSVASGFASSSSISNKSLGVNSGFALNETTVSFAPIDVGPGTYYLTLLGARNDQGGTVFWDVSSGQSSSKNSDAGIVASHSFQILSSVPEPSLLALLLAGMSLLLCQAYDSRHCGRGIVNNVRYGWLPSM